MSGKRGSLESFDKRFGELNVIDRWRGQSRMIIVVVNVISRSWKTCYGGKVWHVAISKAAMAFLSKQMFRYYI